MAKLKYAKCLVQKPGPFPLELEGKVKHSDKDPIPGIKATHLMTADEKVMKGYFSVDCTWLWSGAAKEPSGESHTHDFSQVIGIVGGYPEDPHDLDGEITIWLDGHKEVLTRSGLIFVPAGVVHGPIMFNKINRRVFFITIAMTGKLTRKPAPDPQKPAAKKLYTIMDHTKERFSVGGDFKEALPPPRPSTVKSTRILHIEDDMVPGSFYVDFVWIWSGTGGAPAPEHTHEWNELIAMAGADPAHPRDLGGEMSIVIGDEYHPTTKSTLVCIPAGTKHCPWEFHDIQRPTLVFSAGPQGMYSGSHKKEK
jgi:mannose-6-phosphate isomerase-like protein (cupin superfamily)